MAQLKPPTMPTITASDALGVGGATLACAGVWSLFGWEWAAIALGAPLAALYVWFELKEVK